MSSTSVFSAGIAFGSVIFQSPVPTRDMTILPSGFSSTICRTSPVLASTSFLSR
jgi:hypothetical protein